MVKDLSKQFRNVPPGTLQMALMRQADELTPDTGRPMVLGALKVGDHMAGLATVFHSLRLAENLDNALPVFGPTSRAVRREGLVYDSETGVQAISASLNKSQN